MERYKQEKINLTKTGSKKNLALEKRRSNEELKQVHSQVVQNVADRVSVAFKNFFEKEIEVPKEQALQELQVVRLSAVGIQYRAYSRRTQIYLSGIGRVRIFIHRPMSGKVNRLCIKHEAGEWYGIFLIEQKGCCAEGDRDMALTRYQMRESEAQIRTGEVHHLGQFYIRRISTIPEAIRGEDQTHSNYISLERRRARGDDEN